MTIVTHHTFFFFFVVPVCIIYTLIMALSPTLVAIKYEHGTLQLLDQLQLPFTFTYIPITSVQQGWQAIRNMNVRGAPAIAITAALSVCVEG